VKGGCQCHILRVPEQYKTSSVKALVDRRLHGVLASSSSTITHIQRTEAPLVVQQTRSECSREAGCACGGGSQARPADMSLDAPRADGSCRINTMCNTGCRSTPDMLASVRPDAGDERLSIADALRQPGLPRPTHVRLVPHQQPVTMQ